MNSPRSRLIWHWLEGSRKTSLIRGKDSPDALPAHVLWVEIATRITTMPLHYRSGDEETAAKSVRDLFPKTRELMEKHPDAKLFSELALKMLNETLRPYTARWHGWMTESGAEDEGRPKAYFRDEVTRRMFRKELRELQPRMVGYEKAFKALSEGSRIKPEWLESDKATTAASVKQWEDSCLGGELKAGIGLQVPAKGGFPGAAGTADIDAKEHEFILARRQICNPQRPTALDGTVRDAIGLSLSGGGIRSATVCLGVIQVLARKKLFAEIDYLSTVSGGGYFGSFLSSCLAHDQLAAPLDKKAVDALISETFDPDSNGAEAPAVRHLRNNSRYLLHGGTWGKLKIAGLMVSGLITNLLMILPVPLLAALFLWILNLAGFWGGNVAGQKAGPVAPLDSWAGRLLIGELGLLLLFWIPLPLVQKITLGKPSDSRAAWIRGFWTVVTLGLAIFAVALSALFLVPTIFYAYGMLKKQVSHFGGKQAENAVLGLLASFPFLFGAAARFLRRPWARNLLRSCLSSADRFSTDGPFSS